MITSNYLIIILFHLAVSSNQFAKRSDANNETKHEEPLRGCLLPPQPPNGLWAIHHQPSNSSIPFQVPPYTVLSLKCTYLSKREGCSLSICLYGRWSPFGICKKMCPPIHSTSTVNVSCTSKDGEVGDCREATEGTLAHFKCRSFYEDTRLSKIKAVCVDGRWSEKTPECTPICGRAAVRKRPALIVRGSKSKRGKFPWQVALYEISDKTLICGATLLSEKIVLTAAHCVTKNDGSVYDKELYMVAAGKYYRRFDHPDDSDYSQFSNIAQIIVSEEYRGEELDYAGDIALLITEDILKFSTRVQPVCIDWSNLHESDIIDTKEEKGFVSGWGHTRESSEPANELRSLKVPSISRQQCRNLLPYEYRRYLTFDKFCAGYKNNGTSVCVGDSGGGLVFKKEGRYFITGVVSVAPIAETQEGGCDSQQYSLYTLVYKYTDTFILQALAEQKVDVVQGDSGGVIVIVPPKNTSTCFVPNGVGLQYSKHPTLEEIKPITQVAHNVTLNVSCAPNYKYFGKSTIQCTEKGWSAPVGTCHTRCPLLQNSEKIKVTCTFKGEDKKNCTENLEGTVAKFECAPFHEFSSKDMTPSVCLKRGWSDIPECVPTCGEVPNTSEGRYPWQADIYKQTENNTKEFVCGGSLISSRIIVTAAHCITDKKYGNLLPHKDFSVGVGKLQEKYSEQDNTYSQYSEVEKMKIPNLYGGDFQNYQSDIALIITRKTFLISGWVLPVCLDWDNQFPPPINKNWDNKWLQSTNTQIFVSGSNLDKSSQTLTQVSILSKEECSNQVQEEMLDYFTQDKFCASVVHNDSSICKNLRSGGLIVKESNKHYLIGVSSFILEAPNIDRCDFQRAFFTKISSYMDRFILVESSQYI